MRQTKDLIALREYDQIMHYARSEMDNTAALIQLLESTPETIIHTAPTGEEEDIRILGPDLTDQLRKKLKIMRDHWEVHEELFITE